MTKLLVLHSPKSIRETLCVAQAGVTSKEHIDLIQDLIDECDRHRPLGPDGKHNALHTDTCGCDDT